MMSNLNAVMRDSLPRDIRNKHDEFVKRKYELNSFSMTIFAGGNPMTGKKIEDPDFRDQLEILVWDELGELELKHAKLLSEAVGNDTLVEMLKEQGNKNKERALMFAEKYDQKHIKSEEVSDLYIDNFPWESHDWLPPPRTATGDVSLVRYSCLTTFALTWSSPPITPERTCGE